MKRGFNICVVNEDYTMAGIAVMVNEQPWRFCELGKASDKWMIEPTILKFTERQGSIIREDIFRESSRISEFNHQLIHCTEFRSYKQLCEQFKRDYIHVICDDNYNIIKSFLYRGCRHSEGMSSPINYIIDISRSISTSDMVDSCAHTLLEGITLDDMYHCHEFLIPFDSTMDISQVPNISEVIENGLNR